MWDGQWSGRVGRGMRTERGTDRWVTTLTTIRARRDAATVEKTIFALAHRASSSSHDFLFPRVLLGPRGLSQFKTQPERAFHDISSHDIASHFFLFYLLRCDFASRYGMFPERVPEILEIYYLTKLQFFSRKECCKMFARAFWYFLIMFSIKSNRVKILN